MILPQHMVWFLFFESELRPLIWSPENLFLKEKMLVTDTFFISHIIYKNVCIGNFKKWLPLKKDLALSHSQIFEGDRLKSDFMYIIQYEYNWRIVVSVVMR